MGNGIFLASFWYVFRASNKYLETHTQSPLSGLRASVFLSFRSTETDSFRGCIYFINRLHAYGKFERFKVPLGLDIEHRAHAVLLDAGATSEKYCLTSQTLSDWDYVLGRFCIELSRIQFVDCKKKPPQRPTMRPTGSCGKKLSELQQTHSLPNDCVPQKPVLLASR